MNKTFILFAIAISTFTPFNLTATEECPRDLLTSSPELADLAREWDYMHDAMLAATNPGDVRSDFQTVIDASCFNGLNEEQRNVRVNKLEEGIGRAIERMRTCGRALGIVEASDVIAVLRRTRIRCGYLGPSGLGVMQTHFDCPGSNLLLTAGTSRRYEMTLPVPVRKGDELLPGPNFENFGTEELGSVLAHEAMHVLAMNNRNWHNELASRAKSGCDNSIYYDRVYFTETVCFPNARGGPDFYADGGVYQCREVCMSALTEVDPEIIEQNAPAPSLRSDSGVYGPPIVARPYPAEEAKAICERIERYRGDLPAR